MQTVEALGEFSASCDWPLCECDWFEEPHCRSTCPGPNIPCATCRRDPTRAGKDCPGDTVTNSRIAADMRRQATVVSKKQAADLLKWADKITQSCVSPGSAHHVRSSG